MKLFSFTKEEQDTIVEYINEEEATIREHNRACNAGNEIPMVDDKLTICQLFENDAINYLVDRYLEVPSNLNRIDWSFTGRDFE